MFDAPIVFEPLFMQRVWGGRRLADLYGKRLPSGETIGESWELVDREEAQSRSADGVSLHDLWGDHREAVFGARGVASAAERFPILIKLLDAQQTLSVQVHPPRAVAGELGGESKDELWLFASAAAGAEIYVGLRAGVDRGAFEAALTGGEDVSAMLHRIAVSDGDAMFIPSGRVHAIGGGSVIAEIQQNSDTTYRVFDFNRPGLDGHPRKLHVEAALRSIDFSDVEPALAPRGRESVVDGALFCVERWRLDGPRPAAPPGECAIVLVLDGEVACGPARFGPGRLFLAPAQAGLELHGPGAVVARVLLGVPAVS